MQIKKFQIFRAGKFKTVEGAEFEYSKADIQQIAESFSPHIKPAPLVSGHPKTDGPAMGWVKSLSTSGDRLYATAEFSEELVNQVKSQHHTGVSASFFPPYDPRNPLPGQWYLKHVGFLVSMTPAVKGMEPVEFAEVALDSFERSERRPVMGMIQQLEVAFSEARASRADTHGQERMVLQRMAQLLMKNNVGMSFAAAAHEADRHIKDYKARRANGNNFDRERVSDHESILDIQMSTPGLTYAGAAHQFFSRR